MKFYIVDCFAEERYQGNQLAVFIPECEISEKEMQQIANEMGFSETTFILSGRQDNGGYDVRIFTPDIEVPFAGHPTLGTAYVIRNMFENGTSEQVVLNLKAGQIPVTVQKDIFTMKQNAPEFGEILDKSLLAGVLSINEENIPDEYPVQWVSTGLEAIIVPLKTVEAVSRCRVDHSKFQKFIDDHYKCNVLCFAKEGEGLRARVFMDDPGFLEDPATGSANGNLAGYLLKHDYFKSSDLCYTVSQGIEMGRPSTINVCAEYANGKYTILVGGRVHIVAEGNWR